MNGGKRTSRLRSEFDLWIQAVGGTLRSFQQRREMGRLNSAAAERERQAEEKVATYRAAGRRKAAVLVTGLLLILTLPTWAVVSALTAPSAHNGDTAHLGQAQGYIGAQPASENGSLELEETPAPTPSPEVAGVELPAPTTEPPAPDTEPGPQGEDPAREPQSRPAPDFAPRPDREPAPKPAPRPDPRPACPKRDPACNTGGDKPAPVPTPKPTPAPNPTPSPSPPTPTPPTPTPPTPTPTPPAETPTPPASPEPAEGDPTNTPTP